MRAAILQTDRSRLPGRREALLAEYHVLDTPPEDVFDDLTELAALTCEAPVSFITLLDGDRQWFKSAYGSGLRETPTALSFCAYAAEEPREIMVVEDALIDERFRENAFVTGHPGFRSYAGAPLVGPEGVALGALCVFDTEPRTFTPVQRRALVALARQASSQLETRRRLRELESNERRLHSLNEQLDQFTYIVGHDLRAPIRHQASFAEVMLEDYGDSLNEEQHLYLTNIIEAGDRAKQLIDDLNEYVRTVQAGSGTRHRVSLRTVVDQVLAVADVKSELAVSVELNGVDEIEGNATALRHILVNLVNNALKFCDKQACEVAVVARANGHVVEIDVSDDGPGIPAAERERVFELFSRGANASALPGRGIGLAIAAKLTQSLGGELTVRSELGRGATFTVSLPRD